MPIIGTAAMVADRISYETINASSDPTTTQVESWIDQVEAELEGTLLAAELSTLTVYSATTRPSRILAKLITTGVVGLVKEAWESAKGEGFGERSPETLEFQAAIADINNYPSKWGAMLGGGAAPTGSIALQAHVTDTAITTDDPIPDPIFKVRSDPEAQF